MAVGDAMTPSTCSTCARDCRMGLSFGQYIGKRLVTWRLCVECLAREEALQDGRAQRAIEQAERSGV